MRWLLIIILFLIVSLITGNILMEGRFTFEVPLLFYINKCSTPSLDLLAVALSHAGGFSTLAPISLLILLWLYLRRPAYTLFFLIGVQGAALLNVLLKIAFGEERPSLWPYLIDAPRDASFPSGHSMYSAALSTALILVFWHTRFRWLGFCLGVLFTLAVGLSRLYLGVHFPTDVLVGWLLGMPIHVI